jgi:hypothetical protein
LTRICIQLLKNLMESILLTELQQGMLNDFFLLKISIDRPLCLDRGFILIGSAEFFRFAIYSEYVRNTFFFILFLNSNIGDGELY